MLAQGQIHISAVTTVLLIIRERERREELCFLRLINYDKEREGERKEVFQTLFFDHIHCADNKRQTDRQTDRQIDRQRHRLI